MFGILSFLTGIIAFVFGYGIYTDYNEGQKVNIKWLLLLILFVILSIWFHILSDEPVFKGDIFNRYS